MRASGINRRLEAENVGYVEEAYTAAVGEMVRKARMDVNKVYVGEISRGAAETEFVAVGA